MQFQEAACELDPPVDYVGPQRHRPRGSFNPRVDITKGCYILQRPDTEDLSTYPVHLGIVVSEGVVEGGLNNENRVEHVCDVKWYRPHLPKKRGQVMEYSLKERWLNCWDKKWERDLSFPNSERISVNSVLWCFNGRRGKTNGLVSIPKAHARKAQDNLRRCIEADATN
jgi:hypothetical protein